MNLLKFFTMPPMEPWFKDTPSEVAELATSCIQWVKEAIGVELDKTQDTLSVLDHYLLEAHKQEGEAHHVLLAPAAGAYFGEVVRMHFSDARWSAPEQTYGQWRIEFGGCFLHFNPVGMAMESLNQKKLDSWHGHLQMKKEEMPFVEEVLSKAGKVDVQDYFRLAVRFEIIEQVHTLLSAFATENHTKPILIGKEQYEFASQQELGTPSD